MPKIKKRTIYIFLLTLLALYVVIYIIPGLSGALESTAVLQYGKLKVTTEAECYIVRDETVYGAEGHGKVKYLAREGVLIKSGTKVMEFTEKEVPKNDQGEPKEMTTEYDDLMESLKGHTVIDKNGAAKRKGIFSTYIDGYEKKLNANRLDEITEEDISGVPDSIESVKRENTFVEGDPVYKICDNAGWYLVFWADADEAERFTEGADVVTVIGKKELKCDVCSVTGKEDEDKKIVLHTNRHYKDFAEVRKVQAEIATTDTEGILVENDWIVKVDGQQGVYVRTTTDDYIFKPIQILATDGEKSVVSEGTFYDDEGVGVETVLVYDEVQKNPKDGEK